MLQASGWINIFHNLIIPFLGGFTLTLVKSIADQQPLSFDDANDIALDMVLLSVGARGAFSARSANLEATVDAGVGDAFLAAILLYLRFKWKQPAVSKLGTDPGRIGSARGISQLILGAGSILWTIKAF